MALTATSDRSRSLGRRALSGLAHMRFATKRQIEGAYSGRHRSKQKGGAAEFVDFREYVAGEDLRRLDWKVLARTGRAYLRLFQDETNLLGMLAIDASGSMRFGGHDGQRVTKLEYAQYLATALSHVINRGQDQVGVAVMTERLVELAPPGSNRSHVARVQELIERIETQPTIRMGASMRELFQRMSRRGVLLGM